MTRLERWKLAEPVRLYGYGAYLLAALVVLAAAAVNPWDALLFVAVPFLLIFGAATGIGVESARASCYSPAALTARRR